MEIIINLILVMLLILLTAYFVATEFAIVKIRRSRIEHLINLGNKRAESVRKMLDNLDEYLSACQLGITMASLGLGWLGEPTVQQLLHPLFEKMHLSESLSSTLSFIIAFSSITFLNVVIGELAPKTAAIQKAEAVSLFSAPILILFYKIMFPFIWVLNASARIFSRLFGLSPASEQEIALSEEELRQILSKSYNSGEINQSELQYVNNVFDFDERVAKEIMVPRTEIECVYLEQPFCDNLRIMKEKKYTRYPVANKDKDTIIGMVIIKEVLVDDFNRTKELGQYIRPIISVIETTPIKELLIKMQKEKTHMAILFDEYGGTAGLVTVEDILEELVGEIRDEFDLEERAMVEKVNPTTTLINGKVLLSEVNKLFELKINEADIDTIGGWILSQKSDAKQGTIIHFDNYKFKIKEMDGHQIKSIEVQQVS